MSVGDYKTYGNFKMAHISIPRIPNALKMITVRAVETSVRKQFGFTMAKQFDKFKFYSA